MTSRIHTMYAALPIHLRDNLCSILPTTHTQKEGVKDAGQTLAGESKLRPLPRPPSHTPLIAAASQKLLEELSSKLDSSVEGDGKSEPTSNGVVVEGGREKGETGKEWRKSLPVSDMIETLDSSPKARRPLSSESECVIYVLC